MKRCFGSSWIFFWCIAVFGQSDSLIVQNSKPVDQGRYRDIDGSPYYFRDWVKGSILRSDGKVIDNVMVNYNGYAHEMEVRSGEKIYALDKRWHLRVDVFRDQNPNLADQFPASQLIFQRGAHRDLADKYATILFLGEQLTLIRDCDIGKVQKEFNDVGKTISILRFKDLSNYYLKRSGALIPLKLQKKRIAEAFDNDPRIVDFLTKEKLDLNNESDLVQLFMYADTLK